MLPQIACLRRGIVTLVAFVWLFSTVNRQMFLKIASYNGGEIAMDAFVWIFSTVCCQMCPQTARLSRDEVTAVALLGSSPVCVLIRFLKTPV